MQALLEAAPWLRMTAWLQQQGHGVGPKRRLRLLRAMGLMAVYAKPRLSLNPLYHRHFPYLLKGVAIVRPTMSFDSTLNQLDGCDLCVRVPCRVQLIVKSVAGHLVILAL